MKPFGYFFVLVGSQNYILNKKPPQNFKNFTLLRSYSFKLKSKIKNLGKILIVEVFILYKSFRPLFSFLISLKMFELIILINILTNSKFWINCTFGISKFINFGMGSIFLKDQNKKWYQDLSMTHHNSCSCLVSYYWIFWTFCFLWWPNIYLQFYFNTDRLSCC